MNIEEFKKQFKNHYRKYDVNDPAIIRKYYHSLRVMDFCMLIAKYNNFNENDTLIAMLIGLLHDYARFYQWTTYKTYSDKISIDHGDLAVKMLFDDKEIEKYTLNKENYDEIYDAIKYHNKLSIPKNLSEHNKQMCKVIRDADKLDIFYLLGMNKNLLVEDNLGISEEIKCEFYSEKTIDTKLEKTKDDRIILQLAMVFDLNFKFSFEHIYKYNLIWQIYDNLTNKEKFKEYFEYIDKYIYDKIH